MILLTLGKIFSKREIFDFLPVRRGFNFHGIAIIKVQNFIFTEAMPVRRFTFYEEIKNETRCLPRVTESFNEVPPSGWAESFKALMMSAAFFMNPLSIFIYLI